MSQGGSNNQEAPGMYKEDDETQEVTGIHIGDDVIWEICQIKNMRNEDCHEENNVKDNDVKLEKDSDEETEMKIETE